MDIILINDCIQEGVGVGTEGTKVFRNDGGTDGVSNWDFTEVAVSLGVIDPTDQVLVIVEMGWDSQ